MTTAFHFQLETASTKLERATLRKRRDCSDWAFHGTDVYGIASTSDVKAFKAALRRFLSRHKIVLHRGDNQTRTIKHWLKEASAQDVRGKAQPPSPMVVVTAGERCEESDKTKQAEVQKPPGQSVRNLENVSHTSAQAWPFLCRLIRALSSAQERDMQKWAQKNGCNELRTDVCVIGHFVAGLTTHPSEANFKEALRKFSSAHHIERESRGWFKRVTLEQYEQIVSFQSSLIEQPANRRHILDDLSVDQWAQAQVDSYFRGEIRGEYTSPNIEIAALTHWQRCGPYDFPGPFFKFRCELRNKSKGPETNSFWLRDVSFSSALLRSYGWTSKEAEALTCREVNLSEWEDPVREHKIFPMSSKAQQEDI